MGVYHACIYFSWKVFAETKRNLVGQVESYLWSDWLDLKCNKMSCTEIRIVWLFEQKHRLARN